LPAHIDCPAQHCAYHSSDLDCLWLPNSLFGYYSRYPMIKKITVIRLKPRFMTAAKKSICYIFIAVTTIPNFVLAGSTSLSPSAQSRAAIYELVKLPICNHGLILTGTVTGDAKNALISVKGETEEPYSIGQKITTNSVLIEVYSRGAVIRHDGVLEKLEMTRGAGTAEMEHSSIKSNTPAIPGFVSIAPQPMNHPAAEAIDPTWVKNSDKKEYKFMGVPVDSSDFMTQAKFTPESDGGLTISETVPGGLYDRLGLQDGDSIRSVNGERVDSFLELVNFARKKDGAKEMQVLIMRNSNLYNVQINQASGIEIEMVLDPAQIKQ
jgi:type II secretory pathway component PulC